ncbi:hypothetical protein [Empedobacter falsenii]
MEDHKKTLKELDKFFEKTEKDEKLRSVRISNDTLRMLKILSIKTELTIRELSDLIIHNYYNEKMNNQ